MQEEQEGQEGQEEMDVNKALLESLNSVEVTPEELESVAEAAEKRHDIEQDGNGGGIYLVASMFGKSPQKGQAIYFRMLALSRSLEKQQIPGWTLPVSAKGVVLTNTALIAAAAVCPLVMADGNVCFDRESLLNKALELAEPEGRS